MRFRDHDKVTLAYKNLQSHSQIIEKKLGSFLGSRLSLRTTQDQGAYLLIGVLAEKEGFLLLHSIEKTFHSIQLEADEDIRNFFSIEAPARNGHDVDLILDILHQKAEFISYIEPEREIESDYSSDGESSSASTDHYSSDEEKRNKRDAAEIDTSFPPLSFNFTSLFQLGLSASSIARPEPEYALTSQQVIRDYMELCRLKKDHLGSEEQFLSGLPKDRKDYLLSYQSMFENRRSQNQFSGGKRNSPEQRQKEMHEILQMIANIQAKSPSR